MCEWPRFHAGGRTRRGVRRCLRACSSSTTRRTSCSPSPRRSSWRATGPSWPAPGSWPWRWRSTRPVDVVLMDVQLPDLDGIAVLEQLLAARPDLPVILMMSGHGTIETAVQGHQAGRPGLPGEAHRPRPAAAGAAQRAGAPGGGGGAGDAPGRGRAGTRWWDRARRCSRLYALVQRDRAQRRAGCCITGENGTGKELVARAIHQHSAAGPPGPSSEAELRRGAARAHRERAVRPREGRLHRRGRSAAGQVRAGPRRHAVPRRGRRHAAGDAGEAAARAPGGRVRAGRRHRDAPGRRAGRSRRPTGTSRTRSPPGASARTSTTG